MSSEPENLMLHLLRQMREELSDIRGSMATKDDLSELRGELSELGAELKSDMHSLRADVASDFVTFRKDISDQVVGLRRAVVEYHSSVIGHGMLISELEARMRRVEQHLNLPAIDSH